jgi:hypothetical protein
MAQGGTTSYRVPLVSGSPLNVLLNGANSADACTQSTGAECGESFSKNGNSLSYDKVFVGPKISNGLVGQIQLPGDMTLHTHLNGAYASTYDFIHFVGEFQRGFAPDNMFMAISKQGGVVFYGTASAFQFIGQDWNRGILTPNPGIKFLVIRYPR